MKAMLFLNGFTATNQFIMKKLTVLILAFTLVWNQAASQDFKTLNNNFKRLINCYYYKGDNGEKLNFGQMTKIKQEVLRKIDDADAPIRGSYPIYIHLVDHMKAALIRDAMPCAACEALQRALAEVELLKSSGYATEQILNDYQDNFGINQHFIEEFYKSDYCQHYHIEKGTDCQKVMSAFEKKAKQSAQENNGIDSVRQDANDILPNNKEYKSENGCSMLHEALAKDLLKHEHLEISELPIGDARRIPGVKGAQYEVRFKHEDNKKLLYFEPAWYIIPDRSLQSADNNFWDRYAKAVKEFKTLVLDILSDEDIGGKAFEIYIQGSADSPLFSPRPLVENYHTDFFQNIRLLEVDAQRQEIKEATMHVGKTYDNDELPNLRAAFLKFVLLQMDGMQRLGNHLHIFKGNVKPFPDEHKRSCFIVLVVDWDIVEASIQDKEMLEKKSDK